MELIKPVWWKRAGFWLGILLIVQGVLGVSSSDDRSGFDALLLLVGTFLAIYGWRQGCVTNDDASLLAVSHEGVARVGARSNASPTEAAQSRS